jgi:hypothetical protein
MKSGKKGVMLTALVTLLTGVFAPVGNQLLSVGAATTIMDVATVKSFGDPAANFSGVTEMTNAFTTGGSSTGFVNGWAQLTSNKTSQYGSAAFNRQIDMTSNFEFKGGFKVSPNGNSLFQNVGDGLGIILAPYEPSQMGNGSADKYLGIGKTGSTGFNNAFFWGIDFYYNSDMGDSEIGHSLVGQTGQYAAFRQTDSTGKLLAITSNDGAKAVSPGQSGDDATVTWTPSQVSTDGKQVTGTLKAVYLGKTWSRTITVNRTMGFAVFGSTGGFKSTMSVSMKSFSLTYGTADVKLSGVARASTPEKSDFVAPTFSPTIKAGVIGTTVTILRSEAELAEAQKEPKFDADQVYLAPAVSGYEFIGQNGKGYQTFEVASTTANDWELIYAKPNSMTIKYQYATAAGTYFNTKTISGYAGDAVSVVSPDIAGFAPDKVAVDGVLGVLGDVIVTYYPLVNRPLNPLAPDVSQPVVPLVPGTDESAKAEATGVLTLDYASTFDFGKQQISSTEQRYAATAQKYQGTDLVTPLYAQVTDLRAQAGGWSLQVGLSKLVNTTSGETLSDASLRFTNTALVSTLGSPVGSVVNSQTIPFGEMGTVMTTAAKNGQGSWIARFGESRDVVTSDGRTVDQAVTLVVPGGAAKQGEYHGELTWQLSDTFTNN